MLNVVNGARWFIPQPEDVSRLRMLLVFRLGLPTELADMVIEAAEYYPLVSAKYTEPYELHSHYGPSFSAGELRLITSPLPRFKDEKALRVKKVTFNVESRDQGWGGEPGTQGRPKRILFLSTFNAASIISKKGKWLAAESFLQSILYKSLCFESFLKSNLHHHDRDEYAEICLRRNISLILHVRMPIINRSKASVLTKPFRWFEACILRPFLPQRSPEASTAAAARLHDACLNSTFSGPEDTVFRESVRMQSWDLVEHSNGRVAWHVQFNVTADPNWRTHEITWSDDGDNALDGSAHTIDEGGIGDGEGFISALKPGDCIGLWARSLVSSME